jgi:tetratricopeptide (TPR) repeat protein
MFWQMYQRALDLRLEELPVTVNFFGEDHPNFAASLHNAAVLYSKLKEIDKAIECAERALTIQRKKLGPHHSHTVVATIRLLSYRKMATDKTFAREMVSDERLCSHCNTV